MHSFFHDDRDRDKDRQRTAQYTETNKINMTFSAELQKEPLNSIFERHL